MYHFCLAAGPSLTLLQQNDRRIRRLAHPTLPTSRRIAQADGTSRQSHGIRRDICQIRAVSRQDPKRYCGSPESVFVSIGLISSLLILYIHLNLARNIGRNWDILHCIGGYLWPESGVGQILYDVQTR